MSKKDKKRIAELERQQSILAAKVRIMQYYIGQLYAAKEQPAAFQSGTISSEPKQPETAADSPTRDGAIYDKTKCVAYEQGEQVLNKSTFDWLKQTRPKQDKSEQEKPAQTEPIMTEKEQELMAQLNKELAKFTSLEVFNADRKNFFLPPVGKLEFDKMKAAIECTIAIAKMVRPDYFDKINQIKIPKVEQPETEQNSDGEIWVIHNKLDKTWAAKCSEGGFFWANEKHEEGVLQYADQKEAIEHYNALCSRGLISRMKQQHTAVIREEKQPETDQPTPEKDSENQPEKQQFYLIQTNPNKDQRLTAFYVEMINEKNIVQHTPNPNEAMNFIDTDAAQTEIDTIISYGSGRYELADFKIVKKPTRTI
jgi:hypothetical protein